MSVFVHPFAYRVHCAQCRRRFEPPDASLATVAWARLTMCNGCYEAWEAEQEAAPPKTIDLVSYAGGVGESRKLLSEWLRTSEDVLVENVHRREPDTEQYCGCCWRFEHGEWTQVAVCVDHYTPVPTPPAGNPPGAPKGRLSEWLARPVEWGVLT